MSIVMEVLSHLYVRLFLYIICVDLAKHITKKMECFKNRNSRILQFSIIGIPALLIRPFADDFLLNTICTAFCLLLFNTISKIAESESADQASKRIEIALFCLEIILIALIGSIIYILFQPI